MTYKVRGFPYFLVIFSLLKCFIILLRHFCFSFASPRCLYLIWYFLAVMSYYTPETRIVTDPTMNIFSHSITATPFHQSSFCSLSFMQANFDFPHFSRFHHITTALFFTTQDSPTPAIKKVFILSATCSSSSMNFPRELAIYLIPFSMLSLKEYLRWRTSKTLDHSLKIT